MKCDPRASLLVRTFVSPYFGHEPKVRVATQNVFTTNTISQMMVLPIIGYVYWYEWMGDDYNTMKKTHQEGQ
jgi:hypothetical protein